MGHHYSFSSSVSDPRSNSVGFLVYDGTLAISRALVLYYRSHGAALTRVGGVKGPIWS
jgi:hypothetical protein